MSVKRNTTPVLPIKVHVPLESIKRIEFLFKEEAIDKIPELVRKIYDIDESGIPVKEGEDTSKSFTVLCELTARETMKFPPGDIYMDTRLVLSNGSIPNTKIVRFNVNQTLFSEVYEDG